MANDLQATVVSGVIVLISLAAVLFYIFGFPIEGRTVGWLIVAFVVLAVAARRAVDLQVGFILIGFGLLFTVIDYLAPDVFKEALAPLIEFINAPWMTITGIDLTSIDPLRATILITVAVTAMIYLRIRISGEKRFANTAADKTFSELSNYARRYIAIVRLFVFLLFSILLIVMTQGSELLGEVGNSIAGAPVVASNIFAIFIGIVAIDGYVPGVGEVPVLADALASLFGLMTVVVLMMAVAVRSDSSGPLSQFVSNRIMRDSNR